MPRITISAINTGTEAVTAAGHGLLTGERFRWHNVGGAFPAATPALAAVTDYFAIRVDANNIKVAISSSNALAGTAVNLTGALSGTNYIEYGLPYCIPTAVAVAGVSQVKAADLNGAWGALVALYDLLTAQVESVFSGAVSLLGALTVGGAATITGLITATAGLTAGANQHVTVSGTGRHKHGDQERTISASRWQALESVLGGPLITPLRRVSAGGAGNITMDLDMEVGQRLKSITISRKGDGVADISTIDITKTTAAGSDSSVGSGSETNPPANWADTTVAVTSPTALATGETHTLRLLVSAANIELGNVRIVFDWP